MHLEDDDAATECAECDEPDPEEGRGSRAGVLTPVSPDIAVLSDAFAPRISLLWSTTGFGLRPLFQIPGRGLHGPAEADRAAGSGLKVLALVDVGTEALQKATPELSVHRSPPGASGAGWPPREHPEGLGHSCAVLRNPDSAAGTPTDIMACDLGQNVSPHRGTGELMVAHGFSDCLVSSVLEFIDVGTESLQTAAREASRFR